MWWRCCHDLLEDTEWTAADLREKGFDDDIIAAVVALTRREDETYAAFVARAGATPLAKQVKIADVQDNLGRIDGLAAIDPQKAESLATRYRQCALQTLMGTGES